MGGREEREGKEGGKREMGDLGMGVECMKEGKGKPFYLHFISSLCHSPPIVQSKSSPYVSTCNLSVIES